MWEAAVLRVLNAGQLTIFSLFESVRDYHVIAIDFSLLFF